jgi:hypothetical protein
MLKRVAKDIVILSREEHFYYIIMYKELIQVKS